jgi:hypothetical protein
VTQLADAQLDALRSLRAAYPDAEIAIIGATALAFHIDMTWRKSVEGRRTAVRARRRERRLLREATPRKLLLLPSESRPPDALSHQIECSG